LDELGDVRVNREDDFVDLDLPLVSFSHNGDGSQQISGRGRYGDAIISFLVHLGPDWERQDVENGDLVFHWGKAELISAGAESDAFVQILDAAYGTQLYEAGMRPRVPFLAVSLAGDPARL